MIVDYNCERFRRFIIPINELIEKIKSSIELIDKINDLEKEDFRHACNEIEKTLQIVSYTEDELNLTHYAYPTIQTDSHIYLNLPFYKTKLDNKEHVKEKLNNILKQFSENYIYIVSSWLYCDESKLKEIRRAFTTCEKARNYIKEKNNSPKIDETGCIEKNYRIKAIPIVE